MKRRKANTNASGFHTYFALYSLHLGVLNIYMRVCIPDEDTKLLSSTRLTLSVFNWFALNSRCASTEKLPEISLCCVIDVVSIVGRHLASQVTAL